jgi:internalin A
MSQLALELIAENKETRSTFLDLGNCGLTEVPEEIGELVWLEELSFSGDWAYFDGKKWVSKCSQNVWHRNNIKSLEPSILWRFGAFAGKSNPFSGLVNLKELYLNGGMAFHDLSSLYNLVNLKQLDVSYTDVNDLSPLLSLAKLEVLNVLGTGVSNLSPLSGLKNLKCLNVSSTRVSGLSPLLSLTNLQQLDVAYTRINDLSPLSSLANLQQLDVSSTDVNDLSPLLSLAKLEVLSVVGMEVSDLSPLSGLTNLQRLDVSHTHVNDLSSLSGLINLQQLDVINTRVSDLSPLLDLANIQRLDVSYTDVYDLSPLSGLTNIQRLIISNTPVSDLSPLLELIKNYCPVNWNSETGVSEGIFVKHCPLTNPPVEIVKQGNAAILNYFHEKEIQGTDHLYEAKMLLIGEGGAGKTSLLRRLYQTEKPLPNENETTKGIDIYRHEFKLSNGRNFRLNVWDFGGQEIYHATHQFFLTKRSLYILLDDTRKDDKTVHDASFKYWLEVADLLGEHSPILIFQNEKGGRSKTIDSSGIKAKFNNVKDVYRGNLEHKGAAEGLRKAVEFFSQSLPHIGEELPAKWIAIRADIEQLAKDKAFISQHEYFDIYRKHLEFDKEKALHLSHYLHDLGVFLHFQDEDLLKRTVILQNTWATEAVFKMLDDETVKGKLGHFDKADCQRVWQDSSYADMHPELLALMEKFELCYPLPDLNHAVWLTPQLLPPSKPTSLADWAKPGDLTLRYRYEFLPKGIVSRLMVRMHRFVLHPQLSWINGALFEREVKGALGVKGALFELDDTALLAEVPPSGGEIILRARGAERKELLSVISADLDALNDSFHGLKNLVFKWVPCNCKHCSQTTEPEYFSQENLMWRKKNQRYEVECPKSFEYVDVIEMLDGIRVEQLPDWAKDDERKASSDINKAKVEKTIKIFLASSSELKEDRDAFDLYFRQQNDRLRKQGIYLEIVRWENFLDAMSDTRLQDEYNKEVKACDIFVSLFFTKTGKYTEEEFDVAHQQFLSAKKPLIYTFFKNAPVNLENISDEINSLLYFKKKLAALGHFYTNYDNIEHLKRQFKDQLEKLSDNEF